MKYRLLDLLADQDGELFRIEAIAVESSQAGQVPIDRRMCSHYCGYRDCDPLDGITVDDCRECFSREVVSGTLTSRSGREFPIEHGVPKLLFEVDESTQRTFSLEWKYSKPDERNWGWSITLREEKFLAATAMTPEKLKQSLMLDAGCGSGLLDEHLSSKYGVEIVALDQSMSPFSIQLRNPSLVYPVQGSVLSPPLRKGAFDLIRSAGVLHHTKNTRNAFERIVPLTKGGGRCYVWLYRSIDRNHYPNDYLQNVLYNWIGRNVTSRLPHFFQEWLYIIFAIWYLIKERIFSLINGHQERLTFSEKMQNLVDRFSPRYAWRHSESEVTSWFKSHNMNEIHVADSAHYGFGVRGDMPNH